MSKIYRLMIYFAVAEIMFYSKDVIEYEGMTAKEFREKNADIIQRVFDEGLTIMNYELSYEQMNRAISAYLTGKLNPQSTLDTQVYRKN